MRIISFTPVLLATMLFVLSCGGPQKVAPPQERTLVEESQEATAIIRNSFDSMGGLERLRLSAGKVRIEATADAMGAQIPVVITMGGPDRFRIDYVGRQISYVHDNGACRKIAYEISSRCTSAEADWTTPVRILSALTFPAGDAAKLESTFRMREDVNVNGKACAVPEVRPKNSNLKIKVAYDKTTGLPAQATWYFKDEAGNKTTWTVTLDDWREVKKMRVPFRRTVSHGSTMIWDENAASVDFDAFDERSFLAPIPPTTDQPLLYQLPARRYVKKSVDGQEVEIPSPQATVGGGVMPSGEVLDAPESEVIRIVHRGPVSRASEFFEQLKGGAMSKGRKLEGSPSIILLEEPDGPDSPALMIIYSRLAAQGVSVNVSL